MQTTIKKLLKSEIEITGEISAADFDKFIAQSVKYFSQNMEIPGFRKGHVPEKMAQEKAGEDTILHEAAELALQDAYPKILQTEKIEAIGRPEIVITKMARNNSLEFKIKTAVLPEINLPDYKSVVSKVPATEKSEISEKELTEALNYLRKSRAPHNAGAKNDPENKTEDLPELNDAFAKSVGKFNTLEELKNALRENLAFEKEMKNKEKRRTEILQKISESITWELPNIIIEAEKEKMVTEMKGNIEGMGLKWEDYLKNIKKTAEDLKKEWMPEAEKRVKYGLVIREIGAKENTTPSEAEIKNYTDKMLEKYGGADNAKIDKNRLNDYAQSVLGNEKTLQFLETCESETRDAKNH
ncbi:MAG: hypothetical protein HZC14_00915 [Candidatus Niyogibacteria bacterium]|nr:hypothetical protein [Candidatus Niyogibacteria bacterium]